MLPITKIQDWYLAVRRERSYTSATAVLIHIEGEINEKYECLTYAYRGCLLLCA